MTFEHIQHTANLLGFALFCWVPLWLLLDKTSESHRTKLTDEQRAKYSFWMAGFICLIGFLVFL